MELSLARLVMEPARPPEQMHPTEQLQTTTIDVAGAAGVQNPADVTAVSEAVAREGFSVEVLA